MDATFRIGNIMFNYRVAGVFIDDGQVLLHKQVTDKQWALPGGRIELLEDSKIGLAREMREELGLSVKVDNLLWVVENFFINKDRNFHEIGLYYSISSDNTMLPNNDSFPGLEGGRLIYKWVSLADLEDINLQPGFLKTALKKLPVHPQHLIIRD